MVFLMQSFYGGKRKKQVINFNMCKILINFAALSCVLFAP